MNTEKKLIPLLRFPEFEKDGMWGEKCFGDCLDYEQPQQYLVSSDNYKKEGTPVLTAGKTFVLGFTDESYGIYRQLPVIIFDDFTTASRYVNFPFKAKSSAMKMLQNKDGYDLKFMFEALQNYKYEPKEHQRHWISIFQNFKTLVPSYSEQRKIAECLSTIDSYISSINEKVEQLKAHKKSLLQKLFPQNGKAVPEYRFFEFVDNGEWEIVKLREIAIRVKNKNKFNEQLPVLTNSATEGILNQQDYFDREIVTRDNLSNYFIVKIDDFVYNPRISSLAPVGPISRNKIERGIMSPLYTIFRFCKGCIDYFDYYFRTNCWHQYLRSIANSGARFDRMNITNEEFMNMPIPFPSVAEQQRIAECLSSIDRVIRLYSEKASQLEQHKKGLMQQLFP